MPTNKRARKSDVVIVHLDEAEWVDVFEIPLPEELAWLAGVRVLEPVQIERTELGLLVYFVREASEGEKIQRQRRRLNKLADKMAKALLANNAGTKSRPAVSAKTPNNKAQAVRLMRHAEREWVRDAQGAPMIRR